MGRGQQRSSFALSSRHIQASRTCQRKRLGRLLEDPVHALCPDPSLLRHSRRIGDFLLRLYGSDPERAWEEKISPFIERERDWLMLIYAEHSRLRSSRCLDDYEGLAVIERLHAEPDRVRDEWPVELGELAAIADVAGVRIAGF